MSSTDELTARLERLADMYDADDLPGQAIGVRHAIREVRANVASSAKFAHCPDCAC